MKLEMNLNAKNYNTQLRVHKSPTQRFTKVTKKLRGEEISLNPFQIQFVGNSISLLGIINYLKKIKI